MNVVVVARDPARRRTLVRQVEEAGWTVRADVSVEAEISSDDLDEVAALVLDARDTDGAEMRPGAVSSDDLVEPLTAREHEILEQLAAGLSNRQIAERLAISEHTVKFHVSSVFGKLGVSSRAAAVRHGMRHGLVTL